MTTAAIMADTEAFSHDDWTAVLTETVDSQGYVDYLSLVENRERFDRYLARIKAEGPESTPSRFPTEDDQLAFYINAYNALIFEGVLEDPDTSSVWGTFGTGLGFFALRKIRVDGNTTTLKKLEDDLIRAGFEDPRIHAALNCASIGCPRLLPEAFLGPSLDDQLNAAMTEFATIEAHVRLDHGKKTVWLSKIYDWFADDFRGYEKVAGSKSPSVIAYINRFRPAKDQIPAGYKTRYLKYDKGLNRQD